MSLLSKLVSAFFYRRATVNRFRSMSFATHVSQGCSRKFWTLIEPRTTDQKLNDDLLSLITSCIRSVPMVPLISGVSAAFGNRNVLISIGSIGFGTYTYRYF